MTKPVFMETKEGHKMRVVRRKDESVLITAITKNYTGTMKSWEYPKEFDINKFLEIMKKQGFEIKQ